MTTRTERRPRALVSALSLGLVLAAGACSSGAHAQYSPEEAAPMVRKILNLNPTQSDCMLEKFKADPALAAVMNDGKLAERETREPYVKAMRECLPIDDFGTALGATLRDSFNAGSEEQAACVKTAVLALPTTDQDLLYVYTSNPSAVDELETGPITKKILDKCKLISSAPPVPDVTATNPSSPG